MGQGEVGHSPELRWRREATEAGGGDGGVCVPAEGLDDGPHALGGVGADNGAYLVEVLADPGDRFKRDGVGIGHEDVRRRSVVESAPGAAEGDGAGLGKTEEAESVALLPNGAGRDAPSFGLVIEIPGEDGVQGGRRSEIRSGFLRRAPENVRGYDELQAEFFRLGHARGQVGETAGGEDDGVEPGPAKGLEIVEPGAIDADGEKIDG